jgi:tetratricopeptide (TPR) repeat protein
MVEKRKKNNALFSFGLIMIVKNESHIIEEALASILPIIETYCISDTGSTDDTKDKIKSFFDKHGIPGHIFEDPWKDFGYNRSLALEHASKYMKFGFMLDADDLFKGPPDLNKTEFYRKIESENMDAYKVMITNDGDSLHYQRTQIFNLRRKWKYEGVLHEFPTIENTKPVLALLPWKVISRRLGNRNRLDPIEKYRRDAETLRLALEKEPLNTRHMFYLAQSYRDAEEHEKAIHWYQIRVDFGGWYEEVFFSLFQIGYIYLEKLNREKDGLYFCLKAFKFHPKRIESMHCIAHYYAFRKKEFEMSLQFLNKIKDTPLPQEDGLFVSAPLYQFYALYLYYLMCFLTFRRISVPAEDWTRFPENLHSALYDCQILQDIEILENKYSDNIARLEFPKQFIPVNSNPVEQQKGKISYYRTLNPCIALSDDDSVWFNMRCTNFDVHYNSMDENGLIQTFNFLCNSDFSVIYPLVDHSEYRKKKCNPNARILGYEDMRIFRYRKKWYFIANNDELTSSLNRPQMVLGYLADAPDPETNEWPIRFVVHLQFPYQLPIEKNWCPMILPSGSNESLKIVYSIHPFIVLEPDIVTGYCRILTNLEYKYQFRGTPQKSPMLRGSTPWVPFEKGWLTVGHFVYFLKEMNQQRVYYHFFIYIDRNHWEIRMSEPFHFEKYNIEFATGLMIKDSQVWISYSVSDSIPKLLRIPVEDVANRLIKI